MGEIPHLQAAVSRLKDKPFEILSVSLDDFREMLVHVVEERKVPGIQTWEKGGRENSIAQMYNAYSLPSWFLLDQKGVIRARDPFGEKLVPAVEGLLKTE